MEPSLIIAAVMFVNTFRCCFAYETVILIVGRVYVVIRLPCITAPGQIEPPAVESNHVLQHCSRFDSTCARVRIRRQLPYYRYKLDNSLLQLFYCHNRLNVDLTMLFTFLRVTLAVFSQTVSNSVQELEVINTL